MQPGERVQIVFGVPDLAATAAFFHACGCREIAADDRPHPWIQFSDGQNLILLNQDGMTYRGLIYFNPHAEAVVSDLEAAGVQFMRKQYAADGQLQAALFADPYGPDPTGEQNIGVNIVAHDPAGLHQPPGVPLTLLGKYGEFASFTDDYVGAVARWALLGFEEIYSEQTPYRWGILRNDPIILGYHQAPPDQRFATIPFLTYFAADAADRIAQIKALGYATAFEWTDDQGRAIHAGFAVPGELTVCVFQGEI